MTQINRGAQAPSRRRNQPNSGFGAGSFFDPGMFKPNPYYSPAGNAPIYDAIGGMVGAGAGAMGQIGAAQEGAKGQAEAGRYGAIGNLGGVYGGNYGAYGNTLGQLGQNLSNNYGAYTGGLGGLGNASASMYGSYANALGGMRGADAQVHSANMAAIPQAYTAYGNTLGNLAGANANAYGTYGQGIQGLAQQQASQAAQQAQANAMIESARQAGLGNIGSAALSAYGNAANQGLAAWATNQSAYNKALSDMNAAQQSGISQLGQSRNTALGQLGSAYGQGIAGAAPAGVAASASGNMGGGMGGMGGGGGNEFQADVGGENFATGSYDGTGGVGGGDMNLSATTSMTKDPSAAVGIANTGFSGLAGLSDNVMDNSVLDQLVRNADMQNQARDLQHFSSRNMPSQMLGDVLSGITGLSNEAYDRSGAGATEAYGQMPGEFDMSPYLNRLDSGYGGQVSANRRFARDAGLGYQDALGGISDVAGQYYGQNPYSDLAAGLLSGQQGLGQLAGGMGSGFNESNFNQGLLSNLIAQGFDESNQNIDDMIPLVDDPAPAFIGDSDNSALAALYGMYGPVDRRREAAIDRQIAADNRYARDVLRHRTIAERMREQGYDPSRIREVQERYTPRRYADERLL